MASLSFYQLRISNKDENKDIENASTLQANIHLNSEHLAYVYINNSAYIGKSIYFLSCGLLIIKSFARFCMIHVFGVHKIARVTAGSRH